MKAKPLDLDAIEARANAATPGPWERARHWYIVGPGNNWDKHWLAPGIHLDNFDPRNDVRVCQVIGPGRGNRAAEDGHFIAHAREDVPALVARVRELEEALGDIKYVAESGPPELGFCDWAAVRAARALGAPAPSEGER